MQTYSVDEVYDPAVPVHLKCKIILNLCRMIASERGMTLGEFREYLSGRIHVDCMSLNNNPVGILLLYEYLCALSPAKNGEYAEIRP